MIHEEDLDELMFASIKGCGPTTYHQLRTHFGSASKVRAATPSQLQEVIGEKRARTLTESMRQFHSKPLLYTMMRREIGFVGYSNALYPESLRALADAPIGLFYRGLYELLQHSGERKTIGVVGTRQITSYGRQVTRTIVGELARDGFVVISGMALGVDAVAHQEVLDCGGSTVGVLGCGVDVVYPAQHHSLYESMLQENLLISEFVPGQQPLPGLFVARNRIIAALAEGVLVVEGPHSSGAMITARYAADLGREVYAIPGPITSIYSEGPNHLIQNGAHVVLGADDIREAYGMKRGLMSAQVPLNEQAIWKTLSVMEQRILTELMREPLTVDELVEQTQDAPSHILNALSLLQLQGLIEKNTQSRYSLM